MPIIRGPRADSRFYHLDKRISEDRRLSWGARGLLIYLLGKPDFWKVSVANLINETEKSEKPSGRDAVYGLLKELREAGYIARRQDKDSDSGRFNENEYMVYEGPFAEPDPLTENTEPVDPLTEKAETEPLPGLPDTARPHTANPTQVKNDSYQLTEGQQGLIVAGEADAAPQPGRRKSGEPAQSSIVWSAYAAAYAARYSVEPMRNAKVNGQLAQFIKRVPAEEAPFIAAHFVQSNSSYYLLRGHSVDVMLRDAEKLRTEWATGQRITSAGAHLADATQQNLNSHNEAREMLRQKGLL